MFLLNLKLVLCLHVHFPVYGMPVQELKLIIPKKSKSGKENTNKLFCYNSHKFPDLIQNEVDYEEP